jgi:hypothetical protein
MGLFDHWSYWVANDEKKGPTFVEPQVEVETLGVSEILNKLG